MIPTLSFDSKADVEVWRGRINTRLLFAVSDNNQSVFNIWIRRKITTRMKIFFLVVAVMTVAADEEGSGVVNSGAYADWHEAVLYCANESLALISIGSDEDYEKKIASNPDFRTMLWVHDIRPESSGDRCTVAHGWESAVSIHVQPCESGHLIVCEAEDSDKGSGKELFIPPGDAQNYTDAEEACAEGGGSIMSIDNRQEYYDYLKSGHRLRTIIWVRHHSESVEGDYCVTTNAWEEEPNFKEQPCENHYLFVCQKNS